MTLTTPVPPSGRFGADIDMGSFCASDALTAFLRAIHGNWNSRARNLATHRLDGKLLTVSELFNDDRQPLDEPTLKALQRNAETVGIYGFDHMDATPSRTMLDTLRAALPLYETFMTDDEVDLKRLEFDTRAMVALQILHFVLARTQYWDLHIESTVANPFKPEHLGLPRNKPQPGPIGTDVELSAQCQLLDRQIYAGDPVRSGFHPLHVLNVLFTPGYWEGCVALRRFELPRPPKRQSF